MRALRFRLYPNPEQQERMLAALEACKHLWNDALAHRKRRWEEERRSTSYNHQQWILTAARNSDPELQQVYSQVAQDVLHRLDKAFRSFLQYRSRYPKFKGRREYGGSFTYPQAYNGSVRPDVRRNRLYLSKIGNVRAVFHRSLPKDSTLKTCTVVREPCGEWYASLVYEDVVPLRDVKEVPVSRKVSQAVASPLGIDLGLKAVITASDGIGVPHPKFLRKAETRLKRLQSSLSRKRKGSKNRAKARHRLAVQHAKVARQRRDFNHKLSERLVREHDLIGFEDLRISNMVRNHSLAKSIQDAGWGQLMKFAEYKAASKKGKIVVRVKPAYTTQECYFCGALNQMSLETRKFLCVGCGRTLQRDHNSARIVLKRA
ncbi:MAG: transposase, partial [Thaumarchaeota archaeon]|nr:transposase [Nitrososphaerota archaeon]